MNVLNYNKIILIGNLTADPEIATTKTGKKLCRFRIAVNRRHLAEEESRITDYFYCIAWGGQAEFLGKYFRKGSPILVVGELQSSRYTDSKGTQRYAVEVNAEDIRMVEMKAAKADEKPKRFEDEIDDFFPSQPPF